MKWRSRNEEGKKRQEEMERCHGEAFRSVCKVIDDQVIKCERLVKLMELCQVYKTKLEEVGHPNPNYRGENLKTKLEKHYAGIISFCFLGPFRSYVLYRSDADISNAIRKAYELGSRDMIEETGAHLNQEIWTAFETSDELTWPPTAQTLLRNVNVLPPSLEKFLTCLLSGNRTRPENSRLQRIVSSIGQDICRAATNGEWKLPKHVLICLTLHHMFRSKQLIAISNSKRRTLEVTSVELPDCYVTQRKSPKLDIRQQQYTEGPPALKTSSNRQLLWLLLRRLCEHCVPGLGGFISQTGKAPERLTTIDYYPVIPNPITDYKTVQECLRHAEQATEEVGQEYVFTTFDLGVCMKAYPLVWNNAERYRKHIIMIGTFHLICAYLKMVGKKMAGSGFSDILLEAGLITSGSIEGVLKGKHYERAMNCHKVMFECLEQLLLDKFMLKQGYEQLKDALPRDTLQKLTDIKEAPSSESVHFAINDEDLCAFLDDFIKFRGDVANGHLGKTAQFWISYLDHVRLVFSLLEAVKDNNFYLYAQALHLMACLFFSFGGQNYARYLSYYSVFLANVDISHPGSSDLIKLGTFSVARSFTPGNRCDVDKTMEETFMRHAKSKGGAGSGITGLLTNISAYQRWVRSTHARSQYVNATFQMIGMVSDNTDDTHKDTRPTEIMKSVKRVKTTKDAVLSFMNPFDLDTQALVVLSSGATAPDSVSNDVLRAEAAGKDAQEQFVTDRLKDGKDFFQPIKKLNLKTLDEMSRKVKLTTSKSKIVQYKQQGNIAFQLFVKCQAHPDLKINLQELLTYPLTPVPYSLATADGFLAKTDKAKAFHHIAKDVEDFNQPPTERTLTIHDGNAMFYCMKEVPGNFKLICKKIFDMLAPGDVVFSTDSYDPESIKAMERRRRGTSEKLLIRGEKTKRPPDWKAFLTNDENKQQFINLLLKEWSTDQYAPMLKDRKVVLVCNGEAYLLTSTDGVSTTKFAVESLQSSQEETDTRIVLYCQFGKDRGYEHIRVKSPDTDVFFLLLHYAATVDGLTILFDTGTGNKQRLLNMTELAQKYTPDYCSALLGVHAYSGCDTTSAFKGVGKIKPIKILEKNPKHCGPLSRLGDNWTVSDDLVAELESFTCALYGQSRLNSVDLARYTKINALCHSDNILPSRNIDMGTFPPCKRSLVEHIRRVNFQVGIWKRALIPNPKIPKVAGNGWSEVEGRLEPCWYEGRMLPQRLIDVADRDASDSDATDSESDEDGEFSDDEDDLETSSDDDE
ncbi:hypothetical protein ScPMuIL_000962 [Solemya velum]